MRNRGGHTHERVGGHRTREAHAVLGLDRACLGFNFVQNEAPGNSNWQWTSASHRTG